MNSRTSRLVLPLASWVNTLFYLQPEEHRPPSLLRPRANPSGYFNVPVCTYGCAGEFYEYRVEEQIDRPEIVQVYAQSGISTQIPAMTPIFELTMELTKPTAFSNFPTYVLCMHRTFSSMMWILWGSRRKCSVHESRKK